LRRRSPVFTALDPKTFSSGLQPDVHPGLRVLWDEAQNVTFAAGRVKRRVAPATIFLPDPANNPIRGLSQQQATNGTRYLWSAQGVGGGDTFVLTRWYGPTREVMGIFPAGYRRDESSIAVASFVDFTHYGDWTIANSGTSVPTLFKPGYQGPLGDAPAGVARIMKKLSFMLAIGYGARGTRVGWSDADNIESWTASKTSLAGALSFDDFDTRIKCAVRLGSAIAVYGEDQMGLLSYIGQPFYFSQKTVLDGIGACGKFSVASDGASNFGVGRGGVWWTDGNSYRYIDEGFLHDYLQDNVNWSQQSKITACRNDYTGCFEFSFPMNGSLEPNEAWSFDPRNGGWAPIPAFSIKDERRLFDKPILGTSDGKVMRDQDNPAAVAPLHLLTKPLLPDSDGVSPHVAYRIDEVVLLFLNEAYVEFRLGASHKIGEDWQWTPWQACEGKATTYTLFQPPDGVYFKLQFRSTDTQWQMDLQGFMLFGTVEGTKRD